MKVLNKIKMNVKKHSPEILIVAGVVGVITSTVMACKATTKVGDILEERNEKLEEIKNRASESDEETKKELAVANIQTGVELVKNYIPSVTVGTLSIISILASNNILRNRNVALAAACTTLETGFRNYRKNVINKFGERVDYELKNNIKTVEIEEIEVDEKGKEKKVKKTIDVVDNPLDLYSEYARFYDCGNTNWEPDADYNLKFLRSQQNYFNEILKARGFVFLNEVYEALGIPYSKAGQVVGWLYDEELGEDNYIDFGIYDVYKEQCRNFVNGYEPTILLDFNVDGNIWENM